MKKITAAITGVQGYVPNYILNNKELETMVETNDEWIRSRTGIKERRILKGEGKGTSVLGIEAVRGLLKKINIESSSFNDQVIYEPGFLKTGQGKPFSVFTPFKRRWIENFDMNFLDIAKPLKLKKPFPIQS